MDGLLGKNGGLNEELDSARVGTGLRLLGVASGRRFGRSRPLAELV